MTTEEQYPELPEPFLSRMERLLGEEYQAFFRSYSDERTQGLRLNPLKSGGETDIEKLTALFGLRKVPWAKEGYYYQEETRPGKHVFHDAGVFYIQEPSAMAAAELLDPKPGERILDLCAAPGGKTTHIGGRLGGRGLLVANEIHPARARILSQNVERMGIPNAVVVNEDGDTLSGRFPCFFDRILVDAPCSGEGMFRKEPASRSQWSPENSQMCALRQRELLDRAAVMLKPGGRLVYSTCTFSPGENEETVEFFLDHNPEFSVECAEIRPGLSPGRPQWSSGHRKDLEHTFRIWPHLTEGEGHYIAVLKKNREAPDESLRNQKGPACVKDRHVKELWMDFARETLTDQGLSLLGPAALNSLILFGDQLYLLPGQAPDLSGLRVLRPGLHLGTMKKNRLEPSHSLALYLNRGQVRRWRSWDADSSRTAAYLRGEALDAGDRPADSGWVLMLAEGCSMGWAKQTGQTLKNHYPKGLRRF